LKLMNVMIRPLVATLSDHTTVPVTTVMKAMVLTVFMSMNVNEAPKIVISMPAATIPLAHLRVPAMMDTMAMESNVLTSTNVILKLINAMIMLLVATPSDPTTVPVTLDMKAMVLIVPMSMNVNKTLTTVTSMPTAPILKDHMSVLVSPVL
jgi:hypothetical protein